MHVFFVQFDLIESMCFSNDGYIVCEEHQEILKAAWENEQDIQQKKEQEVCFFGFFFFLSVIDLGLSQQHSHLKHSKCLNFNI